MIGQIANLISVVLVWALVAYIFVFGFTKIQWTGWEGAIALLGSAVALFISAGYTSKWLMSKSAP